MLVCGEKCEGRDSWGNVRRGGILGCWATESFFSGKPLTLTPWPQVADDEDKDLEHGKVCDDMWALDLHKFTVRRCGGGERGRQRGEIHEGGWEGDAGSDCA